MRVTDLWMQVQNLIKSVDITRSGAFRQVICGDSTQYSQINPHLQQEIRQIPSPIHNALNSNGISNNPKEDHVATDDSQTSLLSNVRSSLIEKWLFGDAPHLLAEIANETDGTKRTIFSDEVCDCFQIVFDPARKF